jgi:hypothetical protein
MKLVCSLPCLQEPANKSYSEPCETSLHPHIPFPRAPPSYYPSIYDYIFQIVSYLKFSDKIMCMLLNPPMHVNASSISSSLIWDTW